MTREGQTLLPRRKKEGTNFMLSLGRLISVLRKILGLREQLSSSSGRTHWKDKKSYEATNVKSVKSKSN